MESIYQLRVGSRRTDKYEDVKQNLISCSNAIYFATSPFYRLSTNAKSILGIKKSQLLTQLTKNKFFQNKSKEIIP